MQRKRERERDKEGGREGAWWGWGKRERESPLPRGTHTFTHLPCVPIPCSEKAAAGLLQFPVYVCRVPLLSL